MGRPRNKPAGPAPNRIAEVRDSLGITQEQLAEMIGVEHPTVQRYETGKRNVNVKRLEQIARALKLPSAKELLPFNSPNEQRKLLPEAGNQPGSIQGDEELPENAARRIEAILHEMLEAQKAHNEHVAAMLYYIATQVEGGPAASKSAAPPAPPAPRPHGKPS